MSARKKDETSLGFLMSEFRSRLGVGLQEAEAEPSWTVRTGPPRMTLDNQISATLPFHSEVTVRTGPPQNMPPPHPTDPQDPTIRTPSLKIDDVAHVELARSRRHSPAMLPVPFGLGADAQDLIRTKVARPSSPEEEQDAGEYMEDGATDRYVPLPRSEEPPTPGELEQTQPVGQAREADLPADDGLVLEYYEAVESADGAAESPPSIAVPRRHRNVLNVLFSIGLGVAVGLSLALVGAAFLLVIYH